MIKILLLSAIMLSVGCTRYRDSPTVVVHGSGIIPNLHGPPVTVNEIESTYMDLNDGWRIPMVPDRHSIGNHDYLDILEVRRNAKWIKAKISSRVSAGPLAALAF